jgi:hypothetical protein
MKIESEVTSLARIPQNLVYRMVDVAKPRKWFVGMRVVGVRAVWYGHPGAKLFPGVLVRNTITDLRALPVQHRSRATIHNEYYVQCDADGRIRRFTILRNE